MNLRIVKDYRERNTRLSKGMFYIQSKWLWMWNDIHPADYDTVFYGRGRSWETFEEAHAVYNELQDILKIKRKQPEVVWPPPRREF